jgi:hypothetical protein
LTSRCRESSNFALFGHFVRTVQSMGWSGLVNGNLKPGDADYWRRGYIGLVFACELTDAALGQLDARRPSEQECAVLS